MELKVKYRPMKEKENRIVLVNKYLLVISSILIVILFSGLFSQLVTKDHSSLYVFSLNGILLISMLINWISFIKNSSDPYLKMKILIGYFIVYAVLVITGSSKFIIISMYPILIISILYFDKKFLGVINLLVVLVNTIKVIILAITIENLTTFQIDELIVQFVTVALACYAIYCASKICNRFNHDALHTLSDEKKVQQHILDDMLNIASIIKRETTTVSNHVDDLGKSAEIVFHAVRDISTSTQITAENIQEQTVMTQSIQNAINETAERSKIMVDVASNSAKAVGDSFTVMKKLEEHSGHIAKTNEEVIHSMDSLQDKTKEVRDIASMIFNISSQTNLLALNASIESARAGEAGKGFAVVADQIRELADQTRRATENIAKIIEELELNAVEASETVKSSIVATDQQNQLINHASSSFRIIDEDVKELTSNIDAIDTMLKELLVSNNTIVDNISQLSATTEEITSGSEEAALVTDKNKEQVNTAITLLHKVIEVTESLDKYLEFKENHESETAYEG